MMPNFMRLAIGTLTRLPVPAPDSVNRHVARLAMSMAPAIGMLIALVIGIPLLIADLAVQPEGDPLRSLLLATVAIAALAWFTRALHLDGLADTADALGSGRPAEQALDIARRSDIGPFGVITVALTLMLQVVGLAVALAQGAGFEALTLAIVCGRVAIVLACLRGIPAARPDGLGAAVAGSVPPLVALAWVVVAGALAAGLAIVIGAPPVGAVVSALCAFAVTAAVLVIARRRLGGVTGDVMGACAELATASVLVVLALLP